MFDKRFFQLLSELLINLSAGWIGVIVIAPKLTHTSLTFVIDNIALSIAAFFAARVSLERTK